MSQPTTEQLVVSDLHKRYGDNEVLKGVSLSAHAGDVISIIGSSGSGKSTFLRCINLLERPHIGSITLNGETLNLAAAKDGMLNATDKKQLQLFRAKLAMVFQHFNLWAHLNVLDNITEAPIHVLGLSKAQARERARHYLNKVGLSGAEDKYPAHMSGGQQQRVAIARALATKPTLILADEPTGNLDLATGEAVMDLLFEMKERTGATLLLITHDNTLAKRCDRTVNVADGRIVTGGKRRVRAT